MFNTEKNTTPSVYFKSLEIENIRCFRKKQKINFTGDEGYISQWTVILGNNNTGKTTLLRCLADMELKKETGKKAEIIYPKGGWLSTLKNHDKYFLFSVNFLFKTSNNIIEFQKIKIREHFSLAFQVFSDDIDTIFSIHNNLFLIKYGVLRITNGNPSFIDNSGFIDNEKLTNPEEWLIQTDYAAKNGVKKAIKRLEKIKEILINILPDVQGFRFQTNEETFKSHVEVKTDFGWTRITDLGYGYQTLMAWVVDLAKKMFDHYPNSEVPLKEPAIVLVDEIDLHLHPEWQRKIIHWLSTHFPNTQFIVTAHSPLVVQSAENVNVVLLKKTENKGEVVIEQPDVSNFQGWTVEEILSELMGLDNRIHSDAYLGLMRKFDKALDEDNYQKAKIAYDGLDKILHPRSPQRKLLRLQMASLTPLEPAFA